MSGLAIVEVKNSREASFYNFYNKIEIGPIVKSGLSALAQLALAYAANTLALKAVSVSMVFISLSIGIKGAAIAILVALIFYKVIYSNDEVHETFFKWCKKFACFSLFATAFEAGPRQLIHELGHYVMANLLLKNPKVKISITPFGSGSTEFTMSYGLTYFGDLLGKKGAKNLIAAGGMVGTLFAASTCFIVSHYTTKSNPQLSEGLNYAGISQLFAEILYAGSVFSLNLSNPEISHDYAVLYRNVGFHPYLAIAFLLTPIFIKSVVYMSTCTHNR